MSEQNIAIYDEDVFTDELPDMAGAYSLGGAGSVSGGAGATGAARR